MLSSLVREAGQDGRRAPRRPARPSPGSSRRCASSPARAGGPLDRVAAPLAITGSSGEHVRRAGRAARRPARSCVGRAGRPQPPLQLRRTGRPGPARAPAAATATPAPRCRCWSCAAADRRSRSSAPSATAAPRCARRTRPRPGRRPACAPAACISSAPDGQRGPARRAPSSVTGAMPAASTSSVCPTTAPAPPSGRAPGSPRRRRRGRSGAPWRSVTSRTWNPTSPRRAVVIAGTSAAGHRRRRRSPRRRSVVDAWPGSRSPSGRRPPPRRRRSRAR